LAEPLIEEIERVIFNAILEEDRYECSTFGELREVILRNPTAESEVEREEIRSKTQLVAEETKLYVSLAVLRTKLQEAERDRKSIENELKAIPVKANDEKVKAHKAANEKLQCLKTAIAAEERRAKDIKEVSTEIQHQIRTAETNFATVKIKYPHLLDADTWGLLKLRVDDSALDALYKLETESQNKSAALRQSGLPESKGQGGSGTSVGLVALTAETKRLEKELGLDQQNAKRRADLERRLVIVKASEEKAQKEVAHAEKAPTRKKAIHAERFASYERVFDALIKEEKALQGLYAPLHQRIREDPRLSKLSFVVQRVVDIHAWAERGESILDLRKPPFSRRGMIVDAAGTVLVQAWKSGSPEQVRSAMEKFMTDYATEAIGALAQGCTHLDFGEWLFSTDHIGVRYSIQYEGVEIAQLSPGTRGVVLLTLYLALDQWDRRPLLIDQPEENLDPRSVYSELVPFFRDAAKRRQIIMVTHNANLVVNTDSDQIIVTECQRTSPTTLPQIRYFAAGLEDPMIRFHICRLLEGGEEAFQKRGQRYGFKA
jgi:hypothetical protein